MASPLAGQPQFTQRSVHGPSAVQTLGRSPHPHRGSCRLIKVSRLDGTATAYTPSTNLEGERVFRNLLSQGVGPDEASVDAYVQRARSRDSDLWVVEIEDREGRHFLTEDIED